MEEDAESGPVWRDRLDRWRYGTPGIIARWVLVFPGALAASTITALLVGPVWRYMFSDFFGNHPIVANIVELARQFSCPITFVAAGSHIAPSHQRPTAVVMAILWSVVLTVGFFQESYTHFGLACLVVAIVGSIVGVEEAFGDFRKPKHTTMWIRDTGEMP